MKRLAKALFGQVGDLVGQVKDQVSQGQGQELDNNFSRLIEPPKFQVLKLGIHFQR